MLISTKPDSAGKAAVLFRSRQLTEFRWTPVGDILTYTRQVGETKFPAGQEQLGMIYSSTEPTDKFITENVSFETLMSAMANPDSALYQKNLNGFCNSWPYFGIVCNGLARYALNINRRYSTMRWATVPGMHKIAAEGCYTAEQIHLCDVLYVYGNGVSHVALITDILRDEEGVIRQIEVSEAIRPTCVRRQFDVETYFEQYKVYALWRYDLVDEVPMPDAHQAACLERGVPGLPVIAVDLGNKSNYRAYEDVLISAFPEGENEIEVRRGEEVVETITITGRGKTLRRFPRGYYTLVHKATGEMVEFCVTDPQISHKVEDGKITITANPCDPDSEISHLDFRADGRGGVPERPENDEGGKLVLYYNANCSYLVKMEELTEEEKRTGVFTREIHPEARNFKVYFKNKYGIWTHVMIKL